MRQHHFAGERAFVDYAGDTLEVVDGATGEVRETQIFVGVLGASNLIIAKKPDAKELIAKVAPYQGWIGAMGPVWEKFSGDIGQDLIDAAVASNDQS